MCFGCLKEPFHLDGSFDDTQHMFWLRNKKNNIQLRTLIGGPADPIPRHIWPFMAGRALSFFSDDLEQEVTTE